MAHNFDLYSDVVFMDATYAVNPHRMPLIIFTGINCEGKNCVLGYALVRRETKETYVWLLTQFVLLQRGNAPQVLLTDFDPSMSSAIEAVMPDTTHLLCQWHIMQNLKKRFLYLNHKHNGASKLLYKLIVYEMLFTLDPF